MKTKYRGTEYKSIRDCLKANNGTVDSYKHYLRLGLTKSKAIAKACKQEAEGRYKVNVLVNGKRAFSIEGTDDVCYGATQCVKQLADIVCKYVVLEHEIKVKK